jgi:hypothetical protein
MLCLGMDPSLTNFGWCLHDTDVAVGAPGRMVESGLFKTSAKTLFIDRYIEQRESVRSLLDRLGATYGVNRIGCESPVFHELYSEGLYGLYLYNCEAMRAAKMDVVFFAPGQLKALARHALGRPDGWKMMKPDMVEAAKANTGVRGNLNHNCADAYWAAFAGGRFWAFVDGVLKKEDLTPIESRQFTEIHTYKHGAKAGTSVNKGILYKEDYRFFRWNQQEI